MIVVRTAAESRDLTTVETVKQSLSITDQTKDVRLGRLIGDASSLIEEFTGRVFARELVTEVLGAEDAGWPDKPRLTMLLRRRPVLSIPEVRFNGTVIDITEIKLDDAEAGILFRTGGFTETQIYEQQIVRVRSGALDPLWEIDYSGGYILPSFAAVSKTFVDADVNATTDVISIAAHGLEDGDPVRFETTDTLPTGLVLSRDFYVRDQTAGTFKVASRKGGAAVDLVADGVGTHTIERQETLPGALEAITIDLVTSMFRSEGRDANIISEALGDYKATYAKSDSGLPPRVRAGLARFTEVV